jgi:transposase
MPFKSLQFKRQLVLDRIIVGIDPSKKKHQAAVIDKNGIQMGKAFTFQVNYDGYTSELWKKLGKLISEIDPNHVVFAVETACNLWQTIAVYLARCGFMVLLVSPLTTKHTRPAMNHDFSRTDPKDALIIANNARNGYFDLYREFTPHIKAMHQFSITYCKLNKNLVQNRQRLRSLMEQVFPEFLDIVEPDTLTAMYLLKKYFTPQDFLKMNIDEEAKIIMQISHKQHGKQTLLQIQQAANQTIGVLLEEEHIMSNRLSLTAWITIIETFKVQLDIIITQLIELAKQTRYWDILISFKGNGISDKMVALFIAETRDLGEFDHYKKLEKYAGYNLKQSQSGNYVGPRRMSHIGNRRLSWMIYKMTQESAKYVPEVRMKYLRRKMNTKCKYRKNIVACSPVLLKLIVALVKENRTYEKRPEKIKELEQLEKKFQQFKDKKKQKKAA